MVIGETKMQDNIKFERKVMKMGDSCVIAIPTQLMEYAGISQGDQIEITGDNGKHGNFLAFWKKV